MMTQDIVVPSHAISPAHFVAEAMPKRSDDEWKCWFASYPNASEAADEYLKFYNQIHGHKSQSAIRDCVRRAIEAVASENQIGESRTSLFLHLFEILPETREDASSDS